MDLEEKYFQDLGVFRFERFFASEVPGFCSISRKFFAKANLEQFFASTLKDKLVIIENF